MTMSNPGKTLASQLLGQEGEKETECISLAEGPWSRGVERVDPRLGMVVK